MTKLRGQPAQHVELLEKAVSFIRLRTDRKPHVAVILGSGLGGLADEVEEAVRIPADEIPGYPRSGVVGHLGELVVGRMEGQEVVMVRGRVHCYEGYDATTVAFPVRVAFALGARRLIVTNAAGGIHPDLAPGTLMLIRDHLNMASRHPLVASNVGAEMDHSFNADRRPSEYYDPEWLDLAERRARELAIATLRGVYVWTLGPSYETKAEIRFFRWAGADAVGMSTVPEVVQARELGMRVLGLSTITNRAAGLEAKILSHDDVLAEGVRFEASLRRLVRSVLGDLDASP